jgi:hypothetical protein
VSGRENKVSGFSTAAGLKSGQFERKRNFDLDRYQSKSQIPNDKSQTKLQ